MSRILVYEFGDPSVLRYTEDLVNADTDADTRVVVRLYAAGVNPVDTYVRSGAYGRLPSLPYTPGKDGAGVIESVGAGCVGHLVKEGMRVYVTGAAGGTYATRLVCSERDVFPLPECVSFEQGAGVGVPYLTAYRALFQRCRASRGDTVLIHGASGSVGLAAVQLAVHAGITVVGTASSPEGRALIVGQGAAASFDHGSADELRAFTKGEGFDVILEMLANRNLGLDLTLMASQGGRIGIIGCRGTVEVNPRDAMARELAIFGVMLGKASEEELAESHSAIAEGLASGALRPIVAQAFPLADAARAQEEVLAPTGGARGNIVLVMS